VTVPSSTAAENSFFKGTLFKFLLLIAAIICLLIFMWNFDPFSSDPFITSTLNKEGSIENGNSIFRMNCVGCHGISAQGLVGPDLHEATYELSDKKIINQVTKGLTPPMPSFEIDSQSMADLLSYMHSLN
tara:strand:+ start:1284 stop:1673 length:390 start_codon:yes stop_codon:yes gene_type:complete